MEKLKTAHKKALEKTKEAHRKSVELYRTDRKKFLKIAGAILLVLVIVIVVIGRTPRKMTMKDAGKIGEKKTYQLLIKIDNPRGSGGFDRGDIILAAPEDKQFSIAEQEGFLIVKMGLTEAQSGLLLQSMSDAIPGKEESAKTANEPIRRFRVDLAKMGVKPEEQKGKMITDKVFNWQDVVIEK